MRNVVDMISDVLFGAALVVVIILSVHALKERPQLAATPCTSMHRQMIVLQRVDSHGQLVSTPAVVDVCDKANVAYLGPK